jgi:hypothetical protein
MQKMEMMSAGVLFSDSRPDGIISYIGRPYRTMFAMNEMKPSICSHSRTYHNPPQKKKHLLHPRIIMTKTVAFSHARLHLPHNRTIMMKSSRIDVGKVVQHDSGCKASCCVTSGYYVSPTMLLRDVHVSIVTRRTETVCGVHEVLIIIPYCDVRGCTASDPDLATSLFHSALFVRSFPLESPSKPKSVVQTLLFSF